MTHLERGELLILPAEHGEDVGVEAGAGLVRSVEAGHTGPGLDWGHWRLTSDSVPDHGGPGGVTSPCVTHTRGPGHLNLCVSHRRLHRRGHGRGRGQARLLVRPLNQ